MKVLHAAVLLLLSLSMVLEYAGADGSDDDLFGEADHDKVDVGLGVQESDPPREAGSSSWDDGADSLPEPAPTDATDNQCFFRSEPVECFIEMEEVSAEGPPQEAVDVVAEVLSRIEMATFQIEPLPVIVQPAGGEVLVGMYTIFYTEPRVQRFSTTLLDRGVVLEVEPVRYEWDFGDGSPSFVTSDAGAPYPQQTVTHTYEQSGVVVPELTTRWVGRVWIEGIGGWFAVRGQGVTTGQGDAFEAVSRQNRLVPGPTRP